MAQVDTSIYGSQLQAPKSLIGNLTDIDHLQASQQQIQQQKLNLIGAQRDLDEQQAVRDVYRTPGFDPMAADSLSKIYAASPKAGADATELQARVSQQRAATDAQKAATAKSGYELDREKWVHASQAVAASTDPASARAAIQDAGAKGFFTPQEVQQKVAMVPDNPQQYQAWRQQQWLGLLDANDRISAQQRDAQLAETGRHNQSEEKLKGREISQSGDNARMAREAQLLVNGYDRNGNLLGFPSANFAAAPGAAPQAAKPGAPTSAPPASPYQGMVDAIGNYTAPESSVLARLPPAVKSNVLAAVRQQYPDYDPGTYTGRQSSNRDFASGGKSGMAVKSFNVALAHLDTLEDLTKQIDNGSVPVLNAAGNYIAKQVGGSKQTNLDAAKAIVMNEVVKATTGVAGAESDRSKAQQIISDAGSPEQLSGAIKVVKNLMGGQVLGLQKSYEAGTGKKDFRSRLLSPEAQRAVESIDSSGTTPSAAQGAGSGLFTITHVDGKAVK